MTTLTIQNVPDEMVRLLDEQARKNHRTLDEEARVRLQGTLGGEPTDVENLIARARVLRESFPGATVTEEFLEKAKNWGRP